MIIPQSCDKMKRLTATFPVVLSTSTSATAPQMAFARLEIATPRPVAFVALDGVEGEGRSCQLACFATAVSASMPRLLLDRKSTRLNSSHVAISYAVFC